MPDQNTYTIGFTRTIYRVIPGNIPVLRNLFWIKEDAGRWEGNDGRFKERHLIWNLWWINRKLWQAYVGSFSGTYERIETL